MLTVMRGNVATAHAARLARVEAIPVYPITPSTMFPEKIAEFIADGEMGCEYINCESEHSAMSACIGASAAGARVATATSSQGLAYMHELLFIAAGMRLPIVMAVGNRALSAPINIWCDHQDAISQRDSGWLQFYCESNQEALDLMLAAFRVSEDPRVLLPSMVCLDAFTLTHTMENVDLPDAGEATAFLPSYSPSHAYIDTERPITQGAFATPEHYMEFREGVHRAHAGSAKVVDGVLADFTKRFGRRHRRLTAYRASDAEILLLTMGSMSGTARAAVDELRAAGEKIGLLKVTAYRPFPGAEIARYAGTAKVIAVAERNISLGTSGAVYADVCSSLANAGRRAMVYDFIMGLGGRDILPADFARIVKRCRLALKRKEERVVEWVGIKRGGGGKDG